MKQHIIISFFLLFAQLTFAEAFDGLEKLQGLSQNVYYSPHAAERAQKIAASVAEAEMYFQKEFELIPKYTLMILSPTDWQKYAHPNAVYGIPHYLLDGRLFVAAENNEFWRRNSPPIDKLPQALAHMMKQTYTDEHGAINLTNFFDLLAIHELGHAFQHAAGILKQRSWLNELVGNVLLHTFLAENKTDQLPYITVFTQIAVASFPVDKLKYTRLEDFEKYYNEIAQNHPDNYGWYQCRFHLLAGEIYDRGGISAMRRMWAALLAQDAILSEEALMQLLNSTHPAIAQALLNWNR